jgi:hydroxypyruvate reductase
MTKFDETKFLKEAFDAALSVADPRRSLPGVLAKTFAKPLSGRVLVVGAGKAGASMAIAMEEYANMHWPNAKIDGVVITRYEHDIANPPLQRKIRVIEAAHPVPDQAGLDGARLIMEKVGTLQAGDHLIALISGGGSSLLTLPAGDISMDDLRSLTQSLLRSGAPIEQMNVVRKHLSAIQGGHLAQAAVTQGAQVDAFIVSDVTGDRPEDIASGPCAADPSTYADAIEILKRYNLYPDQIPVSIKHHLDLGVAGKIVETLKSDNPQLSKIRNHVFATAYASLEAAARYCESQGVTAKILSDQITGEAREVGRDQAEMAKELVIEARAQNKPIALISGGECTVTIPKGVQGRGGRCSEFLLSLFDASQGQSELKSRLSALAADTDGIDGSENNAGAWFTPQISQKATEQNLNAQDFLKGHDAYGFFLKTDSLLQTGPTLTNVNDFRILLIQTA